MKIVKHTLKQITEHWYRTYSGKNWSVYCGNHKGIYTKLVALKEYDKKEIDKIIGNTSWTEHKCSQCGDYFEEVLEIGEPVNYESATAWVCKKCLNNILEFKNKNWN